MKQTESLKHIKGKNFLTGNNCLKSKKQIVPQKSYFPNIFKIELIVIAAI